MQYKNGHLYIGGVRLESLITEFGSPLYVYDAECIRARCHHFLSALSALDPQLHYSVKANGNLSLLRLLADQGLGFDIVSGGELVRLQAAGITLDEVGFAGVGKTDVEIRQALQAQIGFFHVESIGEMERIGCLAEQQTQQVRVLLRLNPDVDAKTHHYITTGKAINKFGLDFEMAATLCNRFAAHPWVDIVGFHCHLGSQISQVEPYVAATYKLLDFIALRRTLGEKISYLNLGGGFGIDYEDQEDSALSLGGLADALVPLLQDQALKVIFEPGRSLVAQAGLLLTQVQYVKQVGNKRFVVVDSGMHHLIRPALYGSWHKIWPTNCSESVETLVLCDVVGPICESGDFLAQDRLLPEINPGDVLAVFDVGAYGAVMASNYNTHPRPAEVLIDADRPRIIRRRETYHDLLTLEQD